MDINLYDRYCHLVRKIFVATKIFRIGTFEFFEWPLNFLVNIGKLLNKNSYWGQKNLFHREVVLHFVWIRCFIEALKSVVFSNKNFQTKFLKTLSFYTGASLGIFQISDFLDSCTEFCGLSGEFIEYPQFLGNKCWSWERMIFRTRFSHF